MERIFAAAAAGRRAHDEALAQLQWSAQSFARMQVSVPAKRLNSRILIYWQKLVESERRQNRPSVTPRPALRTGAVLGGATGGAEVGSCCRLPEAGAAAAPHPFHSDLYYL